MDEIYLFQIPNSNHSIITKTITILNSKTQVVETILEQHYDENQ